MQELYAWSQVQVLAFALVLLRMATFVALWPVFSVYNVPQHVKVLFALCISIVIFPLVAWKQISGELFSNQLIWLVAREVFIGLVLGFITRAFFFTVSAAGEMISISMGLSSGSVLNPAMNTQGTAVEQLKVVLATLLFLGFNGHHVFLQGIIKSYELIPLSNKGLQFLPDNFIAAFLQLITVSALKLCAPVMIAILILNLTMGFVGRAVPQINILVMSLPVTILGGLVVMLVCLPLFYEQLGQIFSHMAEQMFGVLKSW